MIKKTQVSSYIKTPLYILNAETGYVLYKPVNKRVDRKQYSEDQSPNLYISTKDRRGATNELQAELKKQLVQKLRHGEISEVKLVLCEIVSETFSEPIEESIESLPDTIDIVYEGYSETATVLKDFADIDYAGYPLVNHSVNVMALALSYCLHNRLGEDDTKRISLCALLHDVGVTKLPKGLVSFKGRLPDRQFHEYQTHASIGHDIIKQNENIDSSIATRPDFPCLSTSWPVEGEFSGSLLGFSPHFPPDNHLVSGNGVEPCCRIQPYPSDFERRQQSSDHFPSIFQPSFPLPRVPGSPQRLATQGAKNSPLRYSIFLIR
jgi:hypothetical protein